MMDYKLKQFAKRYWILGILILVKFILQFVLVNPVYELHRDEFLYLNQADHLAFGYISVPPFTALISKIIFILGGGIFWIRFFPILFGSLTVIITWLIVEDLGGSLLSRFLAAAGVTFSILVRMNMLLQPNSFDILAWTLIFYLLIKYFLTSRPRWLYYLALIIAAGFYNKYNVIFLLAGLSAALLITYHRKLFINITFWKALIICLILLSPNILWQLVHHFPVIAHMKVLKANQLDNNSSAGFLVSQLFFFIGSLPLILLAFIAFFTNKFKPYRFIGISIVIVLALFAYLKAKDYYAAGIFPVLIAFGSLFLDQLDVKILKYAFCVLLISLNLLVFAVATKFIFPVLSPARIREDSAAFQRMGLLRWEDGKNHNLPQDYADELGWKEMADKSLMAYKLIPPAEQGNTLVICYNYGEAGALNFYNRGKMPQAYAFNTDYIYWLPRIDSIKNILLVAEEEPDKNITGMFRNVSLTGSIENQEAREFKTGIYLLTGANVKFTEGFYKKVEEKKKNLDIF